MKKFGSLLFTLVMLLTSATLFAQFEGVIEFTKKMGNVNVKYKYYVKGDNVRIDEIGEDGTIDGTMLVDTRDKKAVALSREKKVYMEVPNKRPASDESVEVVKTGNKKNIGGQASSEWKVKGKEDGTEISYWMAGDDYDFFIPLLESINRKEKQSVFFLQLEGAEGYFPMLSVEKKADGTEVSRLTVDKVTKKKLEDKLFEIPESYSKFEH